MFDRYGPTSLQVTAYIEALGQLTSDEFNRLGMGALESFIATLSAALGKADGRETAWVAAALDASKAVEHHSEPAQKLIAALVASMLVVIDRLSHSEKNIIYNSISHVIDYARLFKKYRQEDWGIEEFCKELTEYDGREVYVVERPDGRGRSGGALCDAIINRGGELFTLEHTALNAYRNQKKHDVLYKRYIKPLKIEEAIQAKYPRYMVDIHLPLTAFDSKFSTQMFESLKQHLISAVGRTRTSINASKHRKFKFPDIPFPVWISRCQWGPVCTIMPMMPVDQASIQSNIRDDLARAINSKRPKLKATNESGNKTVLLIDAGDELYVTMLTVLGEFKQLAPTVEWDGIDQVFFLYGRGPATWAFPLKDGGALYPKLKEYKKYVEWRNGR